MSQPATPRQKQAAKEPQKPKAKKRRMRGDLYDLSGAVAKLKNRKCPRCGSVMAFHGGTAQRWVCGSCSFTDYGQKKTRVLRSRRLVLSDSDGAPSPHFFFHQPSHLRGCRINHNDQSCPV